MFLQKNKKMERNNVFPKDVLEHIASEFLYHEDALNLISCCKDLKIKPYQYNFESNKTIQIKENVKETIYFNKFLLYSPNEMNFDNVKINILKIYIRDRVFKFPRSLKKIHFGWDYNHSLNEKLPQSLEKIKFGFCYNQPLPNNLPQSLEIIKFSHSYNQPLPNNLPQSLKIIHFGNCYNRPLPDNLPPLLEKIRFGTHYNQPLPKNLPQSLEKIDFGWEYNHVLPENLPQSLKEIHFGEKYNKPLSENLLESLSIISFNEKHKNAILGTIYSCINNSLHKSGTDLKIVIKT